MAQIGEWLRALLGQVRSFLGSMPGYQRVTFIGVVIAFLAAFVGFVWWASRPVYGTVFSNLSEPDAAAVVAYVKRERVPYRLEQGGHAVLVPRGQVYEVRLALVSAGLPQGGNIGFELFDKQKLGMTDFLQRLNYMRALQGELSRTISQISGIASARVHLAIPERSLFVSEDRHPTASIVLNLAPGRVLSGSSVAGIVHLVSSSVSGLATDDISVIDNAGRVLAGKNDGLEASGISGGISAYRRKIEQDFEERIESMLGRVVGREKVSARVNAALNLTRVDTTEERVDPDQTAIRSERRLRDQSTDARAAAGGVPGITTNLTNETAPASGSSSQRREETVSYDVSKITRHTMGAVGQIERLSIAVLVDGTYVEEAGERKFVPRPQGELDRYTALVKNAVGFSAERGDRVEVASVPFQVSKTTSEGWSATAIGVLRALGAYAPRVIGAAMVLFFVLMVVRPALARLATQPRALSVGPGETAASSVDVDALMKRLEQENRKLTTEDPERAAYLIRTWLAAGD